MTVFSGFFNSDSTHDRWYNAQHFSRFFDGLITDGVYYNFPESETDQTKKAFYVKSKNTGRQVTVAQGRGWFRGTWIWNDAPISLEFDALVTNLAHRIDAVVIDCDTSDEGRLNDIIIVKGTEAATSQTAYRPTLIDTETHKQYAIAFVEIIGGATAIAQSNITYVVAEPQIDEIGHDAVHPILPDPQGTPAVEALLLYSNLSKAEMKEYIDTQDAIIQRQVDEMNKPPFEELGTSSDLQRITGGSNADYLYKKVNSKASILTKIALLVNKLIDIGLPVKYGGTGRKKLDTNSVLVGDNENNVKMISQSNQSTGTNRGAGGAFFAPASGSDNNQEVPRFGTLPVAQGGTGNATNVSNSLIAGNGTGAVKNIVPSKNSDNIYTGGAVYFPVGSTKNAVPVPLVGTLPVGQGGTGKSSNTANSVLVGNGTSAVKNIAQSNQSTGTNRGAGGAFFATAASSDNTYNEPKFGTLPIAQGGTGSTSAANAYKALADGVDEGATDTAPADTNLINIKSATGSSGTHKKITLATLVSYIRGKFSVGNGLSYSSSSGKISLSLKNAEDSGKFSADALAIGTTAGRVYPVSRSKDGFLAVCVPWTDTGSGGGTVAVGNGGTGKTTNTANSVLVGNGASAIKNIASANGAFYATAANGEPKFGTLQLGQGGTGSTDGTINGVKLGTSGSGSSIKYGYYVGSTFKAFKDPTGTASAGDVLSGKTFANAASDTLVTGTMTNNGAKYATIYANARGENNTYTIPAGYHNGSGAINASLPDREWDSIYVLDLYGWANESPYYSAVIPLLDTYWTTVTIYRHAVSSSVIDMTDSGWTQVTSNGEIQYFINSSDNYTGSITWSNTNGGVIQKTSASTGGYLYLNAVNANTSSYVYKIIVHQSITGAQRCTCAAGKSYTAKFRSARNDKICIRLVSNSSSYYASTFIAATYVRGYMIQFWSGSGAVTSFQMWIGSHYIPGDVGLYPWELNANPYVPSGSSAQYKNMNTSSIGHVNNCIFIKPSSNNTAINGNCLKMTLFYDFIYNL